MARKKAQSAAAPGVGVTTPAESTALVAPPPVMMDWEEEAEAVTLAPRSVTPEALAQYKWYRDLSDDEKDQVKVEGQGLASALLDEGRSRMAVGQHLFNIQQVLEPHNSFQKFLRQYNFRVRKAYRRITAYKNAAQFLPKTVLQVAAIKNIDILSESLTKPLGRYTDAVKLLPPKSDFTADQADKYLNEIVAKEKEIRKSGGGGEETETAEAFGVTPQDPQTLLKESFKFVMSRFKKLPASEKTRTNWMTQLVGMVMAEGKIKGKPAFGPVAVPEEFKVGRGRPRLAKVQ